MTEYIANSEVDVLNLTTSETYRQGDTIIFDEDVLLRDKVDTLYGTV